MPSLHATAHVVVDSGDVVSKVCVNRESSFHRTALQDGFLDGLLTRCLLRFATEGVFVITEFKLGVGIALLWALGRLLLGATFGSLGRERIAPLRSMVVAVGKGKSGAETLAREGVWIGPSPSELLLTSANSPVALDEVPWGIDLTTLASVFA